MYLSFTDLFDGNALFRLLRPPSSKKEKEFVIKIFSFSRQRKKLNSIQLHPHRIVIKYSKYIHKYRGPKLEHYGDKMREILPTFGWLLLLYLVCVLCQSA